MDKLEVEGDLSWGINWLLPTSITAPSCFEGFWLKLCLAFGIGRGSWHSFGIASSSMVTGKVSCRPCKNGVCSMVRLRQDLLEMLDEFLRKNEKSAAYDKMFV